MSCELAVAPAPRVYAARAPVYAALIVPARPLTREVVVTEPAPTIVYSPW
jgi:hypothetical protein